MNLEEKANGMTPLEVLVGARELISSPDAWTKHFPARNAAGNPTAPFESGATCWCAVGAMMATSSFKEEQEDGSFLWFISPAYFIVFNAMKNVAGQIGHFNDDHEHPDILAKFDEAILAEKQRSTDDEEQDSR